MKYCCEDMKYYMELRCDKCKSIFECSDNVVCFNDNKKEFGLIIHDGTNSYITINFCPWCGKKI